MSSLRRGVQAARPGCSRRHRKGVGYDAESKRIPAAAPKACGPLASFSIGSVLRLTAVLVLLTTTSAALGQLSEQDIAALRARGEAEGWTFTVGPNPATALPLSDLCGAVEPPDWRIDARFDPCTPRMTLPAQFDWRTEVGVLPIRNQLQCGACSAFGALGAMEYAILIRDAWPVDLSEQWLISCTNAVTCSGGWHYNAFRFLAENGLTDPCGHWGAVFEADFPYQESDTVPCGCPYVHPYWIHDWAFVGSQTGVPTVAALKQAIYDHGPITVCVYGNAAFIAYTGGIFNACEDQTINHVLVIVGWDDTQGTEGVWILRNSWGPDWGEDGHMLIAYNCSRIGYAAAYVSYTGSQQTLTFTYPDGKPQFVSPAQPTTFRVQAGPGTGTPVPGTGRLYYRLDDGEWSNVVMTVLDTDLYEASLPAAPCFSVYDWYVRADVQQSGTYYDPADAPASSFEVMSATGVSIILDDPFETDQGWSAGAPDDDATGGIWVRVDPVGTYVVGVPVQPEDDHTPDPGTMCFVTGQHFGGSAGASDVDGGKTTLFSPVLDLSEASDAVVSYWRWYSNDQGGAPHADVFVVDISADDGQSWVNAETVGPSGIETSGGWFYHEFRVADFVTPSTAVKIRFVASDYGAASLIEAAVDDFLVSAIVCESAPPPHIVGSTPTDGSIDARVPVDPNTLQPQGWSSVQVSFDGAATSLTPGDFAVTEVCVPGACDEVPPAVASVVPAGNTATVVFNRPIDPKAWTALTLVGGDPTDRIRLGYLPADADGSRMSNANDIVQVINQINAVFGGATPVLHQSDINRSGTVTVADMLTLINLLNGVSPYPEAYFNAQLPALP